MTLHEIDAWFRSFLRMGDYAQDPSQNGIQIQNAEPDTKQIQKIAFAVDACEETVNRAARLNADMLFVHHGLFWSHEQVITGIHYRRIRAFIEADIALYACHLPLDANEEVGNNYGLARRLGLQKLERFGLWKGMTIGVKGEFSEAADLDEVLCRLFPHGEKPLSVLPFGKKAIKTAAVISGGAGGDVSQAIEQNIDLFITGEIGHEQYHEALENGINLIAGGHYQTETVGVTLAAEKVKRDLGIETVFIDVPTGL